MNASAPVDNAYTDRARWNCLVFGTYSLSEVQAAVSWPEWQDTRIAMIQTSLRYRFETLSRFAEARRGTPEEHRAHICVTNYVHALSRAGMLF